MHFNADGDGIIHVYDITFNPNDTRYQLEVEITNNSHSLKIDNPSLPNHVFLGYNDVTDIIIGNHRRCKCGCMYNICSVHCAVHNILIIVFCVGRSKSSVVL